MKGLIVNAEVRVLITDTAGNPRDWADFYDAASYYCRGKVIWSVGDPIKSFLGGKNADGLQSRIDIAPVLGTVGPLLGDKWMERTSVFYDREVLFARDRHMCAYCGQKYSYNKLTVDHVVPRCQGGTNHWTNVVAACFPCNHYKAGRTPEQAHMFPLFVPYAPNLAEKFLLKGKNILGDQMDFLEARISKHSKLRGPDGKIVLN